MNIDIRIVGFDRQSELLGTEFPIPAECDANVRAIARIPETDPYVLGSYALDTQQVNAIADLAHITIDPTRYTYFLEAYQDDC